MYVCMYVCVYVGMQVCTYVGIYIRMYVLNFLSCQAVVLGVYLTRDCTELLRIPLRFKTKVLPDILYHRKYSYGHRATTDQFYFASLLSSDLP
jgi:hypothetical protein